MIQEMKTQHPCALWALIAPQGAWMLRDQFDSYFGISYCMQNTSTQTMG